ncbi:MAG TPA: hypothetical protein VF521_14720, partial [Pyrinomonadaceae bacterium]
FGECGTQDGRQKKAQLTKYYKDVDRHLRATLPAPYRERYVGGYFWWYFGEDMVPKNELWGHLDDLLKDGPVPR